MLNKLFYLFLIFFIVVYFYFWYLAKKSRHGFIPEYNGTSLNICSANKNCVCSEVAEDKEHYLEPYSYKNVINDAGQTSKVADIIWQSLMIAIKKAGGLVNTRSSYYASATFESAFFGFVDDFEVRLDVDKKLIHFRSASRVGRSDFGVNRKRVQKLIVLLEANLSELQNKLLKSKSSHQ